MARSTKSKGTKKQKRDIYQEVTDRVIRKLEEGTAPWRCEWNRYGAARNVVSGTVYSGINFFMLNFFPSFPVPYYLTYKQAQEMGGQVRKGAKSEKVYFFKRLYKDQDGRKVSDEVANELRGTGELTAIPYLKVFSIFNVQDVEGIDFDIPELAVHDHPLDERCEQLIGKVANPPQFVTEDVNGAWYEPRRDVINLPPLGAFSSPEAYYSTLFHELTHSTGHATRLNRETIAGKIDRKSAGYAREELTAEMGAAFLRGHAGINLPEVFDNSAAYIADWLKHLRNDKELVFSAAAQAQKAVDYLLGVS